MFVYCLNSKDLDVKSFVGYDFKTNYDTLIQNLKTNNINYDISFQTEKRKDTICKFKVITIKNYKFSKYNGYLSIYTLDKKIDYFNLTIHNTEQAKPDKSFNNNIDKILNKLEGKRQNKNKMFDVIKFKNAGLVFDIQDGTFNLDILNIE